MGIAIAGTTSLSGWSAGNGPYSSTVGWFSFDSNDIGTDGGTGRSSVAYGVKVDVPTGSTYGTFNGKAWSSNVGWVSFDAADVTAACGSQGKVDLSSGMVTGWAKVLSGSTASGADGCISLSGTAKNGGLYGVKMSPAGAFSGFAWGDVNVGWLSFAGLICPGCIVSQPAALALTCTASPDSVTSGGTVIFTANTTEGTGPYHWSATSVVTGSTGSSETSTVTNYLTGATPPTFTVTDSSGKTGTKTCDPPVISVVNTYTVHVTIVGSGSVSNGNFSCNTEGNCTPMVIPVGSSINLTATSNIGSSFSSWSGGCSGTSPCNVGGTARASDVINVTATFGGASFVTGGSHLWFGSRTRPSDASMASQLPVTISSGNSVNIKYDWDSSIAGCSGDQASGPSMPTNWSTPSFSLNSVSSDPISHNQYGEVTLALTDAHIGTHILRLSCSSNDSQPVASYSANTIKLIVTKSIINEE